MIREGEIRVGNGKKLGTHSLHILGPLTSDTDSANNLKHACSPYSTVTRVLIDCMPMSFLFLLCFIFTSLALYFSIVHYARRHWAPVEWRHWKLWWRVL